MARTRTSPAGDAMEERFPPRRAREVESGFTLIELLVVLAILSLVVALGTPVFRRALPGLELKTGAESVAAALRDARALAIGRNVEVELVVNLDDRSLRVTGEPPLRLASDIGISLLTAREEVLAARIGAIRFYPDGTSTGGGITLALGNRIYRVVVDWLTGRVAVTG
jgi:general secretion pathway protein H